MPPADAHIVRTHNFLHKGNTYEVVAFVKPDAPLEIHVETMSGGAPVIITYPDGFKASLIYSVTSAVQFELAEARGFDAVASLMETAEQDVKRLT